MNISIDEHNILRFDQVKSIDPSAFRMMRFVINHPQKPVSSIKQFTVRELSEMLKVDPKLLYNKHSYFQKVLTDYRAVLPDGKKQRVFSVVSYDAGTYKFGLYPGYEKLLDSSGKGISYESENLSVLGTMYSIALYEQLKYAQKKDPNPTITIKKEDLSKELHPRNMFSLEETLKVRTVPMLDDTDLKVTDIRFTSQEITISAQINIREE